MLGKIYKQLFIYSIPLFAVSVNLNIILIDFKALLVAAVGALLSEFIYYSLLKLHISATLFILYTAVSNFLVFTTHTELPVEISNYLNLYSIRNANGDPSFLLLTLVFFSFFFIFGFITATIYRTRFLLSSDFSEGIFMLQGFGLVFGLCISALHLWNFLLSLACVLCFTADKVSWQCENIYEVLKEKIEDERMRVKEYKLIISKKENKIESKKEQNRIESKKGNYIIHKLFIYIPSSYHNFFSFLIASLKPLNFNLFYVLFFISGNKLIFIISTLIGCALEVKLSKLIYFVILSGVILEIRWEYLMVFHGGTKEKNLKSQFLYSSVIFYLIKYFE
ncbi:hypothetical protein NUSPORA_02552 [Nucleospora cyclopteri]